MSPKETIRDLEEENQQLRLFINKLQRQIGKLYTTDPMTGMPNANYIKQILPTMMATAQRFHTNLIYICIDFEGFKAINDIKGQDYGDRIIRGFANILRKKIHRKSDAYARVGGDEFDIILTNISRNETLNIIQSIKQQLKKTFPEDNISLHIGACEYFNNNITAKQLRKRANEALKNKYHIFREKCNKRKKRLYYFFYKIRRVFNSCLTIIRVELLKRY